MLLRFIDFAKRSRLTLWLLSLKWHGRDVIGAVVVGLQFFSFKFYGTVVSSEM